ncbi:MAG: sulfotransferase family protein [Flavobacteriales bacterium]
MRFLNAIIGGLQLLGITPKRLDADVITKKAMGRTGLSDLGSGVHVPGMMELVKAVNNSPVTNFGKLSSTGFGVDALTNRLRLIDHLKANPQIRKNEIKRPIFIVGFPRTGTTLLQNLLHLSDDYRALPFWEITNPIPRHSVPEKDIAKRHRITKGRLAIANFVVPEMKFIHEVRHDSLEECWPLMISQFTVSNWDMTGRWPGYGEWMLQHDMKPSYQEYKDFLRIMVERVPDKQLILKCPDHMWYLDDLLEVFPDACIVWTHRDPSRSIPSYCSLASLNWRLLYGEFKSKDLGPYIEERFLTGINRALEVREKLGEDKFLDVNFNELLDDPIKAVNKITSHFNLNAVSETKMQEYLDTDRPDNRGKHKYTADHYGIDREKTQATFKHYTDRFGVSVS